MTDQTAEGPLIDLKPSDEDWVRSWMRSTEYMLGRLPSHEVKKMVDNVRDGRNYKVDAEGNLVSDKECGVIEMDKTCIRDRMLRELSDQRSVASRAHEMLSDLKERPAMPGRETKEQQAKIEVLEELLDGVQLHYEH
jgi:hypothetical protein